MPRRRPENWLWVIVDEGWWLLNLAAPYVKRSPEELADYQASLWFRSFAEDIVERVAALAAGYDRLCALSVELEAHTRERASLSDPQWMEDHEHLWAETDVTTSFIQYELYSVAGMLSQLLKAGESVVPGGSELEYVISFRNRLLTHPVLDRLVRVARRGGSYGGSQPVQRDAGLSVQFYERYVLAGLDDPEMQRTEEQSEAARKRNEAVIRSTTKNERLTKDQLRDLLAFGARDPSVRGALVELAELMYEQFLPHVSQKCDDAIRRFGYRRVPTLHRRGVIHRDLGLE